MRRVGELLGQMRALAHIEPPKGSYADERRFLEQCRSEGIAGLLADSSGQSVASFATPFGLALLRRWRWVEESERMGIPYAEAAEAFKVAMERDAAAIEAAAREQQRAAARAKSERDEARRHRRGAASDGYQREGADLLDYANGIGL